MVHLRSTLRWVSPSSLTMKKTTTTITKTTSRTTSARRRTTLRSTTTTVDDGNDARETKTTTKKTSSSRSSSSTASTLMMDAFLPIDDEETTQPSSSNMSLVALASRIEKECFPRLEEKDIPTTNDDDVGDGGGARKRRLGQNDDAILSTNFSPPLLIGRLTLSLLSLSLFASMTTTTTTTTTTDEELVALHHRVRVSGIARAFKQLLREEKFRGRFTRFRVNAADFSPRVGPRLRACKALRRFWGKRRTRGRNRKRKRRRRRRRRRLRRRLRRRRRQKKHRTSICTTTRRISGRLGNCQMKRLEQFLGMDNLRASFAFSKVIATKFEQFCRRTSVWTNCWTAYCRFA